MFEPMVSKETKGVRFPELTIFELYFQNREGQTLKLTLYDRNESLTVTLFNLDNGDFLLEGKCMR